MKLQNKVLFELWLLYIDDFDCIVQKDDRLCWFEHLRVWTPKILISLEAHPVLFLSQAQVKVP